MPRRPYWIAAVIILVACETPTEPESIRPLMFGTAPDPCPECEGIYLSRSASSEIECVLSPNVDLDEDDVDDACEFLVAQAFRPQLVFHSGEDDKSRESYWAVKRTSTELGEIGLRIAYLLAYHDDRDHDGDSELIEVYVHFDESLGTEEIAGRWVLDSAYYSAHTGAQVYGPDYYEAFPGIPGRYLSFVDGQYRDRPIAWVADAKHANYSIEGECDNAGFLDGDRCNPGSWEDVEVLDERNIGSYEHKFINAVYSIYYPTYAGLEYMWGEINEFCGWQAVCLNHAWDDVKPYGTRLHELGWY